jgi:hypothetical protein
MITDPHNNFQFYFGTALYHALSPFTFHLKMTKTRVLNCANIEIIQK